MIVIGMTGGIGSGKTTAANLFNQLGITIIDADIVARDMVARGQPALKQIAQHFGNQILDPQGSLDRAKLRNVIFNDASQRQWLENLLHPLVAKEIRSRLNEVTSPYGIIVVPLLFESTINLPIDRVLVIDSSEEQQRTRAQKRDNLPEHTINAILNAQFTRQQRLAKADDIIKNNGDMNKLIQQVQDLHQFYLQLAQTK